MERTILRIALAVLLLTVYVSVSPAQRKLPRTYSMIGASANPSAPLPPSNGISYLNAYRSSLWIGSSRGLAQSSDGGRSWISYGNDDAFADYGIFAMAFNGDTIWSSTGHDQPVSDGSTVQTGSGYTYSYDGGSSWHHLSQAEDARGDSIYAYGINDSLWFLPVVVPQENVTFDIALTTGTVWIASWASGLRKSTDGGQHWQRVLLPSDGQNEINPYDTLWTYAANDSLHLRKLFQRIDPRGNNNYLAFGVFAEDDDTIWCGTAGGVNKSTDGGVSWNKFNHQNQAQPIMGDWVIAIAEQKFGSTHRIWTTNWKADDPAEDFGVSYSDNGGLTWKNMLYGDRAYAFAFKDSIAYIAGDAGLFRTSDGGNTFTKFSTVSDAAHHAVITASPFYCVDVLGDTVYAGTADGMASTIDNAEHPFGENWTIYRAYQALGTTHATYAYPNPFSPAQGVVRIHYSLAGASGSSATVSVQVFDFGMNRVRTVINGASRATNKEYDEIWDGTTDGGAIAANGVYFYRVDTGSGDPVFGKILLVR